MSKKFDIGIIGGGVAGALAAAKIAESHKDMSAILFDVGRPPGKRRRQLEGWLGCFPFSDGKIYINDFEKVLDLVDGRKVNAANKWFKNNIENVDPIKVVKDKLPGQDIQKKIKNSGFDIKLNDHIQWRPNQIHSLSHNIADKIESAGNIIMSFDNEVYKIVKSKKNEFTVFAADGEYTCKRVILCVGRSGWRWVNELYKELGISAGDDTASFGIRVEIASSHLKDFNKSHCTLTKNDLEIGPFSWNGTVIPEDHADVVISSFRSNEDRWKSDKVSFSLLSSRYFKDSGCYEADRIGKLAFLLSNDRIGRERIKSFVKGYSQLSLLPEYSWLNDAINEISAFIPNIQSRGYFHVPHILPCASKVRLGTNLESEIDGLFIAGESSGIFGIAAAGIMGAIAADSACR